MAKNVSSGPVPTRSLRLWQLGVIVAFVCSAATVALSSIGIGPAVLGAAFVGWIFGPFLLLGLLQRLRTAAGLPRDEGMLLQALGGLFMVFVFGPMMLIRTARAIGNATADPELVERVKPFAIAFGVMSFSAGIVGALFPVVGVVLGPLTQLVFLGLATQVLLQHVVETAELSPVPRAEGSTGHAAPVGIRTH